MENVIIDISNIATWAADIVKYLNSHKDALDNWANNNSDYENSILVAQQYDKVIYGLKEVLSPYYLHGYHCTRLTEDEINIILSKGMDLPSADMLKQRIERLIDVGILEKQVAEQLLSENQAADYNRRGMIWFCFFEPHIAGQAGIERLFRLWGGEALYNSHENNSITRQALSRIGKPCVIEADIPLSGFEGHTFEIHFANHYMANLGLIEPIAGIYEGNIKVNLPSHNITNIIRFPSDEFVQLTHCDIWDPEL